jgi:hypothetical protein
MTPTLEVKINWKTIDSNIRAICCMKSTREIQDDIDLYITIINNAKNNPATDPTRLKVAKREAAIMADIVLRRTS